MRPRPGIAGVLTAVGLMAVVASCTSDRDAKGSRGSLTLAVGATSASVAGSIPSTAADEGDDALSLLRSAVITIAGIEARMSDGTWIPLETGLPAQVDVIAAMNTGMAASLPSELIPEGDYDSLGLRITVVEIAPRTGAVVALAPPGNGWTVRVPVNFSVTAGHSTVVELSVHGASSFKRFDGAFVFDPELEVADVEHD